jgi:hypothetical protein
MGTDEARRDAVDGHAVRSDLRARLRMKPMIPPFGKIAALWTRMLAPRDRRPGSSPSVGGRGEKRSTSLEPRTASPDGAGSIATAATGVPEVVVATVSRTLRKVTTCGTGRARTPADGSAVAWSITPHSAGEAPPCSDQDHSLPHRFPDWLINDVVGSGSEAQRDAFIDAVRRSPPLGLVGIEKDGPNDGLVLSQWLVPHAVIREGEVGRRFHPMIGVDVLGFRDEFDELWPFPPWDPGDDHVTNGLLRHLAMSVSRRFDAVRTSGGHDALVASAAELHGLGAVPAAGAVAGAAFERLMRRATVGDLRAQIDAGDFVRLHRVIKAVAPSSGNERLMDYKDLRNDIAHRLGDESDPAQTRSEDELYEAVAELIAFLSRQSGDDEHVVLVDADPRPVVPPEVIHADAVEAAQAEVATAQPRTLVVGKARITEGGPGSGEVVVRDLRRAFTRWLSTTGVGDVDEPANVVRVPAPHDNLEQALAWCYGYCGCLRAHDVPCGYSGNRS